MKGDQTADPRGLIFEAYRMDITDLDCRTIFFDWALGFEGEADPEVIRTLLDRYGTVQPDHPMTRVLREGLATGATAISRRGGSRARRIE